MKIYIRKSSKSQCDCGALRLCYSLIQNKIVRATICEDCYKQYVDNLKGFELIFLTFSKLPNPLPKFLRRVENESKVA